MSQGDPTDHALATIASILEPFDQRRRQDKPTSPAKAATEHKHEEKPEPQHEPAVAPQPEADGYVKIGPGPLASIRFKWTVRRGEDRQYYVHETVGDAAAPLVLGPMSADAAIQLVDEREGAALQRFERLKAEMAVRVDTAELIRLGGGEA